jgi:hypothetical protein
MFRVFVGIRPEVSVCVERLGRRLVAEAGLDGFDAGAVADEKAGVEVPEVVEGDLIR